jgi:hypothetical protein
MNNNLDVIEPLSHLHIDVIVFSQDFFFIHVLNDALLIESGILVNAHISREMFEVFLSFSRQISG